MAIGLVSHPDTLIVEHQLFIFINPNRSFGQTPCFTSAEQFEKLPNVQKFSTNLILIRGTQVKKFLFLSATEKH